MLEFEKKSIKTRNLAIWLNKKNLISIERLENLKSKFLKLLKKDLPKTFFRHQASENKHLHNQFATRGQ